MTLGSESDENRWSQTNAIVLFNTSVILSEGCESLLGDMGAHKQWINKCPLSMWPITYYSLANSLFNQKLPGAWAMTKNKKWKGWSMGEVGFVRCRLLRLCPQAGQEHCSVPELLSSRKARTMGKGRQLYLSTSSKIMETFVQIEFPILQ